MRRLHAAQATAALAVGLIILGANAAPASAQQTAGQQTTTLHVDVMSRGSSSLLGIRKAKAAVPVARMHATSQQRVGHVLKNLSLYRKLPDIRCETDPRVVDYFLANPDVAVDIWRVLGVSEVTMTRTGANSFAADDGQGSRGTLHVVYRDTQQQVLLCDGVFVNPVSKKPIRAEAVIHFRHRTERSRDGRTFSRHDATMFISLPSNTVEAVARAISPVSNKLADQNFEEVSRFVRMMNVAMTEQPDWIDSLAARLANISQPRREELVALSQQVYVGAGGTLPGVPNRAARVQMATGQAATQTR